MKKIANPFVKNDPNDYKCFGCSPKNDIGLHLEFFDNGDELIAFWEPQKRFEGYFNILHGGIQATILDEIAAWVVNTKCKTAGVTSSLKVKYCKPVPLSIGTLTVKGKIASIARRLATIQAHIEDAEGHVLVEAEVVYFLFSEKDAKEKYNYPGVDAFYDDL